MVVKKMHFGFFAVLVFDANSLDYVELTDLSFLPTV